MLHTLRQQGLTYGVLISAAQLEKIGSGSRVGPVDKNMEELAATARKYRQTLQSMRESRATKQLSTATLTRAARDKPDAGSVQA